MKKTDYTVTIKFIDDVKAESSDEAADLALKKLQEIFSGKNPTITDERIQIETSTITYLNQSKGGEKNGKKS